MNASEYPNYPELRALKKFSQAHQLEIISKGSPSKLLPDHHMISFCFRSEPIELHYHDEYGDLQTNNTLLHIACCLQELEAVEESADYLQWCTENGFDAANSGLLDYYKALVHFNDSIRTYFKDQRIESFVNSLDFQLNQRAVQALRNNDFSL